MIKAGELPIAHSNSVPNIYDLDGDNIKDLILGNTTGYIYFFKNTGSNAVPLFETEYETLKTVNDIFINAYANSRINFIDWTGDGDLDMLVGGAEGNVWICENSTMPNIKETRNIQQGTILFNIIKNPTRDKLYIQYKLVQSCSVLFKIYSADGRVMATIQKPLQQPGSYYENYNLLDMNGGTLRSGVYFIELSNGLFSYTEKIIFLR